LGGGRKRLEPLDRVQDQLNLAPEWRASEQVSAQCNSAAQVAGWLADEPLGMGGIGVAQHRLAWVDPRMGPHTALSVRGPVAAVRCRVSALVLPLVGLGGHRVLKPPLTKTVWPLRYQPSVSRNRTHGTMSSILVSSPLVVWDLT
jgi:hypothetical protein